MKTKEEIKNKINEALAHPAHSRNSMGCLESYYDPHYMVGKWLEDRNMTFDDIDDPALATLLVDLAGFAGDVFC